MASKKKIQIVEAAAKLFKERGYAAASMRDVAEEVSLTVSSLYSHIKGKDDLLRLICFGNSEKFHDGITKVEKKGKNDTERLRMLVRLHIVMSLEHSTTVTVFNDEWKHLPEPHLSFFKELRRSYEQRVLRLIEAGLHERGLNGRDARLLMYSMLSSLNWLHYSAFYRNHPNRESVINELENMILRAIIGD